MTEPTALNEARTRELLEAAATTVDVGPSGPLDTSLVTRPRWPVVLAVVTAAAAVVAVVAAGRWGADDPPRPASVPTAVPTAGDDRKDGGDDGAFRLGPDQVPSVFGMTESTARAAVEREGFAVEVAPEFTCQEPSGRAARTKPSTGMVVAPGDSVTVFVTQPAPTDLCAPVPAAVDVAYRLVDAARGQGPPPATSADVDLGPALDLVAAWSSDVTRDLSPQRVAVPPRLSVHDVRSRPPCLGLPWGDGDDWFEVRIQLDYKPVGGPDLGDFCRRIYLHWSAGEGSPIDRVLTSHVDPSPADPAPGPVPDVVGNSLRFATERLEAAGYTVRTVGIPDCAPSGIVTGVSPPPGIDAWPGPTVTLAHPVRRGPCADFRDSFETVPEQVADDFADWGRATGSRPAPAFAEQVRVFRNDVEVAGLTAQEAADASSWQAEGAAELLGLVPQGPLVATPALAACPAHPGELPGDLRDFDLVRLQPEQERGCERGVAVEVFVDLGSRIAAVSFVDRRTG